MTCVDAILSAPSLAGLVRVNDVGGARDIAGVCVAERFSDLEAAPSGSLVILGRVASESATDYRFDMALRWAALAAVGGRHRRPGRCRADLGSRETRAHLAVADRARRGGRRSRAGAVQGRGWNRRGRPG